MKKLLLLITVAGTSTESNAAFLGRLLQRPKTIATGIATGAAVYCYKHTDQKTQNSVKKYTEKTAVIGSVAAGSTASFAYGSTAPFIFMGTANPRLAAPRLAFATGVLGCIVVPSWLTYYGSHLLSDIDEDYAYKNK